MRDSKRSALAQAFRVFSGAAVLAAMTLPLAAQDGDSDAPPPNYGVILVGTTPAFRPPGGPWDGFQKDITVQVGYGRFISDTVALELDLGPTFVSGEYVSFSLVPGILKSLNSTVYLAGRVIIPVDPETDVVLFPGIGVLKPFGNNAWWAEVNVSSAVTVEGTDIGIALTVGAVFGF